MTDVWQENGQIVAAPVMIQASRAGSEVPADVASRALILMGERYPKAYRECLGDALLGES